MSLLLLFSPDDALRRDLEARLPEAGLSGHTFLHFPGEEDLRTCLRTLGDIRLVFIDLRHLDPPPGLACPVLGLCDADAPPTEDLPRLSLPLRTVELRSLVRCLTDTTASLTPGERFDFQRHLSLQRFHSGLAHDLNNRLTTLSGYLIMLTEDVPEEAEALTEMRRAAEEASDLIRLIQSFRKRDFYPPHAVDAAAVLDVVGDLAGRLLGSGTRLGLKLPEPPAMLHADEAALETLALTLLSWFSGFRGTLTLELRRDQADWVLELAGPDRLPESAAERIREESRALRDMLAPMEARLEIDDPVVRCLFRSP